MLSPQMLASIAVDFALRWQCETLYFPTSTVGGQYKDGNGFRITLAMRNFIFSYIEGGRTI